MQFLPYHAPLLNFDKHLLSFHGLPLLYSQYLHYSITKGLDTDLHFHRFEHQQSLSLRHGIPFANTYSTDLPGHRRGQFTRSVVLTAATFARAGLFGEDKSLTTDRHP